MGEIQNPLLHSSLHPPPPPTRQLSVQPTHFLPSKPLLENQQKSITMCTSKIIVLLVCECTQQELHGQSARKGKHVIWCDGLGDYRVEVELSLSIQEVLYWIISILFFYFRLQKQFCCFYLSFITQFDTSDSHWILLYCRRHLWMHHDNYASAIFSCAFHQIYTNGKITIRGTLLIWF